MIYSICKHATSYSRGKTFYLRRKPQQTHTGFIKTKLFSMCFDHLYIRKEHFRSPTTELSLNSLQREDIQDPFRRLRLNGRRQPRFLAHGASRVS